VDNTQHGESSINIKIERSHTLRFFNKSISDCKLEDLEWGKIKTRGNYAHHDLAEFALGDIAQLNLLHGHGLPGCPVERA